MKLSSHELLRAVPLLGNQLLQCIFERVNYRGWKETLPTLSSRPCLLGVPCVFLTSFLRQTTEPLPAEGEQSCPDSPFPSPFICARLSSIFSSGDASSLLSAWARYIAVLYHVYKGEAFPPQCSMDSAGVWSFDSNPS